MRKFFAFIFITCLFFANFANAYVQSNNVLVVGVVKNNPPIAFTQNGQARGLAVDLAVMFAKNLKKEVVFRTGSFYELRQLLAENKIDFICASPPPFDPSPNEAVLPVSLAINRRILVANPNVHITCEQDFEGQQLGILIGDPYLKVAEKSGAMVSQYLTYNEAFQALINGEIGAFIAPSGEVASYMIQQSKLENIRFMGLSLERIPLTIILNKDESSLLANLSGALTIFEEKEIPILREKWLGKQIFEEDTWQKYGNAIIYTSLAIFILMLGAFAWSFFLKREVSRVTNSLKSSEKRYRELIEASPDLILLVDKYGQIFLANRIARETLNCNYDCEEGDDALCMSLCDEGYKNLQEILAQAIKGVTSKKEIIINSENKGKKLLEFIVFPADVEDINEPLVCCIARDMTERKHMEKELVEVEKLAVIGKMAAGVAHEVNNPLGIILANAEVLLEEEKNPNLLQHLQAIQRNVERAATIIKRLLHLTSPSSTEQKPQNLAAIIQETLLFLQPKLKSINVDTAKMPDDIIILGDKGTLEQLFLNLFLNAIESLGGKGEISIIANVDYTNSMVSLAVVDTGAGIEKKNLERIFDIFYTTRGTHGFGLGLYISRRIAEQHGGILYAESELGEGTAMKMEFPLYINK